MGVFATGAVVLIPFPYSDLSQAKVRPVVVLADAARGDVVLCQVTSSAYADANAVELTGTDFTEGALLHTSYARPAKLFTVSASLAVRRVGVLGSASRNRIVDAVVDLLRIESSN
jgi:mRNA interferase MazF